MTSRQVTDLEERLSERDWLILSSVRGFRFLTTRQIARQHFDYSSRQGPIPRNVNQALVRLRDLGLLASLARRIGGVRAGSGGFVWQLTDRGERALGVHFDQPRNARARLREPGTTFLDHTLAIAEVVLALQDSARAGRVRLVRMQPEPECWRSYLGSSGETRFLKPDVAVVTESARYEDHWFIEVDRATEPPNRVVKKCLQYQEYMETGIEQGRVGLYPAVVWAVPNDRRREQLSRRLHEETTIDREQPSVIRHRPHHGRIEADASLLNTCLHILLVLQAFLHDPIGRLSGAVYLDEPVIFVAS